MMIYDQVVRGSIETVFYMLGTWLGLSKARLAIYWRLVCLTHSDFIYILE